MNNTESVIINNLGIAKTRINEACIKAGRDPQSVQLCLVTKTVVPPLIIEALVQGETLIAENKVQELKSKFDQLAPYPHQAHFIGHLQSNKIKEVLDYVTCIQSIDRMSLVEKLDQRLQQLGKSCDVLLQFNTSFEESKFGMSPLSAIDFAKQVAKYDTLRIKGLMTIGLFSPDAEDVRKCFQLLMQIKTQIADLGLPNAQLEVMSMGMSNDLEIAIAEGSTMVRVGTAIFGKRQYPDSYYWNETK